MRSCKNEKLGKCKGVRSTGVCLDENGPGILHSVEEIRLRGETHCSFPPCTRLNCMSPKFARRSCFIFSSHSNPNVCHLQTEVMTLLSVSEYEGEQALAGTGIFLLTFSLLQTTKSMLEVCLNFSCFQS